MNSFEQMEAVIAQRRAEPQEGSYTCYLFEKGIDKILKKVGEEFREKLLAYAAELFPDASGLDIRERQIVMRLYYRINIGG